MTTTDASTTAAGETEAGSCGDVEGNYEISIDSDSPEECSSLIIEGLTCSVAQTGCNLAWGCPALFGTALTPGPLGSDGIYEANGSIMGVPYSCEIDFGIDFFFWSCSITAPGGTLVCQGSGD